MCAITNFAENPNEDIFSTLELENIYNVLYCLCINIALVNKVKYIGQSAHNGAIKGF